MSCFSLNTVSELKDQNGSKIGGIFTFLSVALASATGLLKTTGSSTDKKVNTPIFDQFWSDLSSETGFGEKQLTAHLTGRLSFDELVIRILFWSIIVRYGAEADSRKMLLAHF